MMAQSQRAAGLGCALRATAPLVLRFFDGFDDSNRTAQPAGLPNHASWVLGHLALTMNRFAERYDGLPLPERDYLTGDGASGTPETYDTESVCFGSVPVDNPNIYPTVSRGIEVFQSAIDRLGGVVMGLSDDQLGEIQPWGRGEFPTEVLIARIMFHNGTHAGQIMDLRRALGLGRVIG